MAYDSYFRFDDYNKTQNDKHLLPKCKVMFERSSFRLLPCHKHISNHWLINYLFNKLLRKRQRKYQRSALLVHLWWERNRWLVDSPHKWPVMLNVLPCHYVNMIYKLSWKNYHFQAALALSTETPSHCFMKGLPKCQGDPNQLIT